MEILLLDTPLDVAFAAADEIATLVSGKPDAVLGVATGSSPLEIYTELARRTERGELDFSRASAFALDEYVGIPADHPESYLSVITKQVVEPLGFDPTSVRVPDGRAADLDAACADYESGIAAAGGIDLQILGIGTNGHIGFNEPTSSFASRTRVKTLASQTVADNARFFDDPADVPRHCLTQGLGTIMEAKHLVLVAQGESKARAIAAMVEGPVSSMWPGSIIQHHPHVTVIVDAAAASQLTLTEYYRSVRDNKRSLPGGQ
jgi:glucosamine-6-phosphate deaminase